MQHFRIEQAIAAPPPAIARDAVLALTEQRVRVARANHMGYPYNLAFATNGLERFSGYLVNNLGDPYAGSHYGTEVCELERQVVAWFETLWECDAEETFWGSVGASGTEGNFWAIYLGRESLPGAVLIHSAEAHYSIPKAARILGIETLSVRCDASGAVDLDQLAETLKPLERPVILALTCGTTMKGAHDDIGRAIAVLDMYGYDRTRRYVHVDGALNAMVLPFVADAPASIKPSFRTPIDSLSTSGHKMVGTPMPCGVLIARRRHVNRVASAISYLRSSDTTLMGSRNGHAVLALWNRIAGHGMDGFTADVNTCLERAERLVGYFRHWNLEVFRNPHSLTVVFPEPGEEIVRKYQLACEGGFAHAVIMPNVDDALIDRFMGEYLSWVFEGR